MDKSYLHENWQDKIKDMPIWRQEKIKSFLVNEPKKLSLMASMLFVKAMEEIDINIDIKNIKIAYTKNQKPYIEDQKYKDIKFNISHSQDKAILVTSQEEVGCDIEKIHDIDLNLAKRFYTNEEYKLILSNNDIEKQKKIFYKMWTLKESYLKLTGKGIIAGLDSVDFSEVDYNYIFLENKTKNNKIFSFVQNGEVYYFHNFDIEDYMISICTKSDKNFYEVKFI